MSDISFDLDEETVPGVPISEEIQTEMLPEPVRTYPVFDVEAAKKQFAPYLEKIESMLLEATSLVVESEAGNEAATFLGTSAKQIYKKIEEERTTVISESSTYVKSVNAFVKIFTEKLEKIEAMMKQKIASYRAIQEQNRRERELAQKKAADELQAKLNLEAKEKGIEPVQVVAPLIPKEPPVTRTETGSSHGRKVWTFEITEPSFFKQLIADLAIQWEKHLEAIAKLNNGEGIPCPTVNISESIKQIKNVAPYLVVSDHEVRNAIKGGIREIVPAIRIFQDARTTFRT